MKKKIKGVKAKTIKAILKKIAKEVKPGLYVVDNPRCAGYPSVEDIKNKVLPRFQKKLLESAKNSIST